MQMRNPKEIEKTEYNEFYKKTFNEFLDPLAYTHFTTEVWAVSNFTLFFCLCELSMLR
jgi:HSP90 family molecular chaperone